jgi:hypothetical protein
MPSPNEINIDFPSFKTTTDRNIFIIHCKLVFESIHFSPKTEKIAQAHYPQAYDLVKPLQGKISTEEFAEFCSNQLHFAP